MCASPTGMIPLRANVSCYSTTRSKWSTRLPLTVSDALACFVLVDKADGRWCLVSGWHTVPAAHVGAKDIHYADTRGNNVFAQENFDGGNSYLHNYRPTGGANMTFDFAIDLFKSGVPLPPKSESCHRSQ